MTTARIFSGVCSATASMSMPPAAEAMSASAARSRLSVSDRYSSRAMSEPLSTYTRPTGSPSGPVCAVTRRLPSISPAAARAASTSAANVTPPPLPRPPPPPSARGRPPRPRPRCPPRGRGAPARRSCGTGPSPGIRADSLLSTGRGQSRHFARKRPPLTSRHARACDRGRRPARPSPAPCDAHRVRDRGEGARVAGLAVRPRIALPATSASAAAFTAAPSDLAWRVIGLLNLYRLLVPLVLLAMQSFAGADWGLVTARPKLFVGACIAYFTAAVLLVIARRLHWSSLRIVALVNASVDALAIGFILYASGGSASGLGILLVLPVFALTVLADRRDALLIAAAAALAVLVQQVFVGLSDSAPTTDYVTAGVFGVVLFMVALATGPVANRLRQSEALVRRQEVDLANMAQLSQYIVQHLRESILVLDEQDRIRLINESAAQMLGDEHAFPAALIGEASPRLLYLLESWRKSGAPPASGAPDDTFVAADGARLIRPHFAPLAVNPGPVLIFLEDTSVIEEKVQQSKLAALGRLSASIAHEIRNPVGAMSHAGQLLAESPHLTAEHHRLTQIIRSNAERVGGIIDKVQRLARRQEAHLERLPLDAWIDEFRQEFCETMQWPPARLKVSSASPALEVRVDPDQLRQIVWNLCENALKHAIGESAEQSVEIRYGRMTGSDRPFLEVADRGAGVASEHADRMFEPFYSGGRGTGLGLFLARELAQANGAALLYEPRPGGGSIFRLVFADPRRWEW